MWHSLKDKRSVGVIEEDIAKGLLYIARPMGVVCAVTPSTNPIVTPMSNAMFALKGRNSVIIAPHPNSKLVSSRTVEMCNKALSLVGAPENLIQIIKKPSLELTDALMKHCDVVVATGGMNMVKAAYSSGKPAYGVGAGNVQALLDRGIDFEKAVKNVIQGRSFDNGIICAGEQSMICHKDDLQTVLYEFNKNGGYFIESEDDAEKIRKSIFTEKGLNRDIVGKSVKMIAKYASIDLPDEKRVLGVMEADLKDPLRREKMCPVILICTYNDFEEGVDVAQYNLDIEGKGHTCVIHSDNREHIVYAGNILTVSRLVVNQPGTNAGGSFYNGFNPTNTLGCGSWGNNSISENFTYKHLINVQQVGMKLETPVVDNCGQWE